MRSPLPPVPPPPAALGLVPAGLSGPRGPIIAALTHVGLLAILGCGDSARPEPQQPAPPADDSAMAGDPSDPDDSAANPPGEPPGDDPDQSTEPPPDAPRDPAPWSADKLARADVPKVYLTEHRKAENRSTCPLLVPTDLGAGAGAKPRRANFHGGWAVAYDKKGLPGTSPSGEDCADCGRSAFGVAGAGVGKGGGPAWPNEIIWSDGSKAGYGAEGGSGSKLLAYVEAADAGCLYNVWSVLGEEHLVTLLKGLRRAAEE
jgi:hypothetical protein